MDYIKNTEAQNYIDYLRRADPEVIITDPAVHGALLIAVLETEDHHSSSMSLYQFQDLSCIKYETVLCPPGKLGSRVTLAGRARCGGIHTEFWIEVPKTRPDPG